MHLYETKSLREGHFAFFIWCFSLIQSSALHAEFLGEKQTQCRYEKHPFYFHNFLFFYSTLSLYSTEMKGRPLQT